MIIGRWIKNTADVWSVVENLARFRRDLSLTRSEFKFCVKAALFTESTVVEYVRLLY